MCYWGNACEGLRGRNRTRQEEEPSYHNAGLTPVKEKGKEEGLGRKGFKFQSSSKKNLLRPLGHS